MTTIFLASALVPAVVMVAIWGASLRLRDVSIVDVFWGPAFAAVAWTAVAVAGPTPRGLLAAVLVTVWGLRLGIHLGLRKRGQGEDRRYAAMRAVRGPRFAAESLLTVFLLQAALLWVISLPLQTAAARGSGSLSTLDALGALVALAGVAVEATADAQLARFLARPGSRGQVMQEGLWRWSRHPNYFGDFLAWWGLGLLGVAAGAAWALVGPTVMSVLLLRVSGVTLLERTISERRPGYTAYAARTSSFFPWPPRRERV
ncbi:MAG TPA: DUF1295 domain-containing protein [Anaeromyxobacter sp.]|nr:DUF1295 domain-containing protein [Anaeromyxobacter sp.]